MARLPISRVVDVTLTRQDRFATTRGFGVALILTTDASGPLDASTRTRVYGSMQEVEADWGATTEPYKAALAVFSQNPSPRQLKIGYVDAGVLDDPASPTITEELDALYAADPDWYWLTTTREFRDTAILDDIFAWTDARPLLCIVDSNDALMEDPTDTTNVAARNKMTRERAGVFYHTDATVYPAAALIGYCARRNIDEANSAYTAKFKRLSASRPSTGDRRPCRR